ncbi:hypothetical protein AVEN_49823-1 [Araneus ventricosus]|uniref:Uncharacterized protein n=1 Tax=Araneus ventricosus TaxID=182803 RepID=A0A4Y2JLC0_ARAVE|nr:hypothetical protein AVEN_49823-1 [Araneus ventricosus]
MGLCSRRPTCMPLLTKRHRQLRLQCAREHRDWPWMRGRELPVRMNPPIHHVDGRVGVRRLQCEQLLPSCSAGHTQAGGSGIMLWGTFSWAALTLRWRLSSQLEMESASRTTSHVTRLGLCWSGSKIILMNST